MANLIVIDVHARDVTKRLIRYIPFLFDAILSGPLSMLIAATKFRQSMTLHGYAS